MTRPGSSRPAGLSPIAASMAGAVDLSGLKQRATQGAAASERPSGPAAGTEVTEANFEAEVLARSSQLPVVVVLWSPRSEASAQLADLLAGLAAEDNGTWALASVNVDTSGRVAQAFGVQAIPTVVALAGGQPIASFQGTQPPEALRKWVDSLLTATAGQVGSEPADGEPEQVDPVVAAAREHLDNGDFDAAKAAYEEILAADPAHEEAKAAVRQITFLSRATATAPDAVEIANAAPGDIDAAFAAADAELLAQDVAAAFKRLTALVKTTAGDDKAKVRTRLVELFELFDPTDPDVIAGRRNLANALY